MQQHDHRAAGAAAAVGHLLTALPDLRDALRKPSVEGLQQLPVWLGRHVGLILFHI